MKNTLSVSDVAHFQTNCKTHRDWIPKNLFIFLTITQGEDCAKSGCMNNCSSTPTEYRGFCYDEFPSAQCLCVEGFGGLTCEEKLCLNNCAGHGTCDRKLGICKCDIYYAGQDCSVFAPTPGLTADPNNKGSTWVDETLEFGAWTYQSLTGR